MMDKDTIDTLEYYAQYLEGLKTSIQRLESQMLQTVKEQRELQRAKNPELEVIDPEMATWE